MIIAITGLMGVGKTTVSQMFESLGANVINADDIGHELLCRNEVKNRILSEFGSDVLTDDIIDREKLASKVFNDESRLEKLNKIMHPLLISEIKNKIKFGKIYVIDAALFYELKLNELSDFTIKVTSSRGNIIRRLAKRKLNKEQVLQRHDIQKEAADPDFIINNDSTLEKTKEQVKNMWGRLIENRNLSGKL